jgi:hypothetical protein
MFMLFIALYRCMAPTLGRKLLWPKATGEGRNDRTEPKLCGDGTDRPKDAGDGMLRAAGAI